jgi:hypothetical protein
MESKYSRGKIYQIVCNKTGLVYVGSTIEPTLCRRLAGHVKNYRHYLTGLSHYVTSYKIIENEDYQILLLENYSCESKDQLTKKEGEYIRTMTCVNKNIPGRSVKEWYHDNKEIVLKKTAEYYRANKEVRSIKASEYHEVHKEEINQRKKEYYKENRDKINQRHIEYYKTNKEEICKKSAIKNYCKCGGTFTHSNKHRHSTTKQHQEYLAGDWEYIWE